MSKRYIRYSSHLYRVATVERQAKYLHQSVKEHCKGKEKTENKDIGY